jgi:phosphopantothenoylcysteine decarboxylase/phosphopantothenate--cysteine ligase
MRILITAGPTWEPIDSVRFIGNRSSGKMGAALVEAALKLGHQATLILGPCSAVVPHDIRRLDIETTGQLLKAVTTEFPAHDLLIMAAAVADFRPRNPLPGKLQRAGTFNLELESTPDILQTVSATKRPDQRTVGFGLELAGNIERARSKLHAKNLDLIVYNTPATLGSEQVEATLVFSNGITEELKSMSKSDFAHVLLERSAALFPATTATGNK